MIFVTLPILMPLLAIIVYYLAIWQPVWLATFLIPLTFGCAVKYTVDIFTKTKNDMIQTTLTILIAGNMWCLWYQFTAALNRHLAGLPIITKATESSLLTMVAYVMVAGFSSAFLAFIFIKIRKYAERKRMRREV